ncbi:BTAD domain-containing putative transcriptional regulator [Gordonia sp. VNK21]|uniref:BTAD domain-containing putative transcriptional regulator n=1 Tax=Gordonia sp. VNK21 TaxID=3382483 RepID=UPI0038D438DA
MSAHAGDEPPLIGLLGPVTVDGTPVPGLRARRLLTSLALTGGRVLPAGRLIDEVWDDAPPRSPANALQTQISRLRPLLGTAQIVAVAAGYRLDGARTDLELAGELLTDGGPAALERAAGLWRGEPGGDLGDGPLDGTAGELRRRAGQLHSRLELARGQQLMEAGDYRQARTIAENRCAADPLDEEAHLLLMRALAAQGERARALAVYAGLRRVLSTELGIDPGPAITALNTRLLADDPETPDREPSAGRAAHSGLRAGLSPLLGRDADLAAIEALLTGHRLVTVQGPGGVGKTSIAHAVGLAAERAGRTVQFVPLAAVRDDADVAAAVAGALGVGESELSGTGRLRTTIGELADVIAETVGTGDLLLILDNCEQVIDGCARLVGELLAAAPNLQVLATSRSPLILGAEAVHQLPALPVHDDGPAVELFVQRARAVRPGATLDRDEVAALCGYLDGLPLAIELAAARIRTMSVAEITGRLAERFALLRSADRTVEDRHRTLYAVIEWSWELLTDDARTLLTALCRFPGGFDAAAAGSVGELSGVALDDALTALVDQSLLQVSETDGRVRYRMMETVREFGEYRLAGTPDASARIDAAMAGWARALTAGLLGSFNRSADPELGALVDADADNLVWVLRRALTPDLSGRTDDETAVHVFPVLAALWMLRGLHAEIGTWGARVLGALHRPPAGLDAAGRERWQFAVLAAGVPQVLEPDSAGHEVTRGLARIRMLLRPTFTPEAALTQGGDFLTALALQRTGGGWVRQVCAGVDHGSDEVRRLALSIRQNLRENAGNLTGALRDSEAFGADLTAEPWMAAMNELSASTLLSQQGRWAPAAVRLQAAIDGLQTVGADEEALQARLRRAVSLIGSGDAVAGRAELEGLSPWRPGLPAPNGDPEFVVWLVIAWAELARTGGTGPVAVPAAGLFGQAIDLVEEDYDPATADPGRQLLIAVGVAGLILVGERDRAREHLGSLTAGLRAALARSAFRDIPQIGSSALALGAVLGADEATAADGAALMEAARPLRLRQDFPALGTLFARRREQSVLSDGQWDRLAHRAAHWSRRQALDAVTDALGRRAG